MFDTVYVNRHFNASTLTATVTENRAPTDESVRLLREMEQAARDKIIKSIELESNTVSGRVFVMKDYLSGMNNFAVVMDINGKRVEIKTSTNEYSSREAQIRQVYTSIAEQLTNVIMPDLVKMGINEGMFK